MKINALFLLATITLINGCDQISQQLGLEDAQRKEAKADAEGKAVGSACRQSGRAIEDCYSLYRWLPKASIFTGWREMNDYMQANNLGIVEPKLPPAPGPEKKKAKAASDGSEDKKPEDGNAKPAEKTDTKEAQGSDKTDAKASDSKAEKNAEHNDAGKKDAKAATKH